jgi:hypothetical protein
VGLRPAGAGARPGGGAAPTATRRVGGAITAATVPPSQLRTCSNGPLFGQHETDQLFF